MQRSFQFNEHVLSRRGGHSVSRPRTRLSLRSRPFAHRPARKAANRPPGRARGRPRRAQPARHPGSGVNAMRPFVSVTGLRQVLRRPPSCSTGSTSTVPEGTVFALLGPNGAGKTTAVQILSTLIGADAGEIRVAGHDLAREPDAVRAAIGVTGQFSAVDNLLTGEENLRLMADLHHLGRAEGRRARPRAAGALRPRRRGAQARGDLLRRHAPPARPRDGPGRRRRGSSSSTSRPPAWTRAAAAPCGRSSATSSPAA